MHFSRMDVDGDDDPNIPRFVANSKIGFAVLDKTLIPFCRKMRMCIGEETFSRNSATPSNTPVGRAAKVPTEKTKQSGAIAGNSHSEAEVLPVKKGQRPIPIPKNPALRKAAVSAAKEDDTNGEVEEGSEEEEDKLSPKKGRDSAKTPTQKRKRSGAIGGKNTGRDADPNSANNSEEEPVLVKKQRRQIPAKPDLRKRVSAAEVSDAEREIQKGVEEAEVQLAAKKAPRATAKKSKSLKVLPNLQGDSSYQQSAPKATNQARATRKVPKAVVPKAVPEARSQPVRQAKQKHSQIPPERKIKGVAAGKNPA